MIWKEKKTREGLLFLLNRRHEMEIMQEIEEEFGFMEEGKQEAGDSERRDIKKG